MSLERASKIHQELIKTAAKFLSPSFRDYFTRKAERDFAKLKSTGPSAAEKYISEQNELKKSLNRVVGLYNCYRDDRTTL